MTMIWKSGVAVAAILGLAASPCWASIPTRTHSGGAKLLRAGDRAARKITSTKYDTMLVRHFGFGGFHRGFGGFHRGFGGFGRGFGFGGFRRVGFGRGFGFGGFRRFGYGGFRRFGYGGFGRFGYGRYGYGYGGFFPGFGLGLGLGSLLGYGYGGYGYPYYGYGYGGYGYPYYGGYGYGYGYSPYVYQSYYYPGYSYTPYSYCYPTVYSYSLGGTVNGTNSTYTAPIMPPASDGTFPYDGGPNTPVPLPQAGQPAPQAQPPVPSRGTPRQTAPAEGRIVSIPAPAKTKFAYRAYGEKDTVTSFAQDRTVPVRKPVIEAARR